MVAARMQQEQIEEERREAAAQERSLRECPQCAEQIKKKAKVCRFCGHQLADRDEVYQAYLDDEKRRKREAKEQDEAAERERLVSDLENFKENVAKDDESPTLAQGFKMGGRARREMEAYLDVKRKLPSGWRSLADYQEAGQGTLAIDHTSEIFEQLRDRYVSIGIGDEFDKAVAPYLQEGSYEERQQAQAAEAREEAEKLKAERDAERLERIAKKTQKDAEENERRLQEGRPTLEQEKMVTYTAIVGVALAFLFPLAGLPVSIYAFILTRKFDVPTAKTTSIVGMVIGTGYFILVALFSIAVVFLSILDAVA